MHSAFLQNRCAGYVPRSRPTPEASGRNLGHHPPLTPLTNPLRRHPTQAKILIAVLPVVPGPPSVLRLGHAHKVDLHQNPLQPVRVLEVQVHDQGAQLHDAEILAYGGVCEGQCGGAVGGEASGGVEG